MDILQINQNHEIIVAVILLVALIGFHFLSKIWRRRLEQQRNRFWYMLIENLSGPVEALMTLSAVYMFVHYVNPHWAQFDGFINGAMILTIGGVAWLALRGVKFSAAIILRQYDINRRDNLSARVIHTQIRVIQRIAMAIIVVIGIASALMVFQEIRALGVSLLASAGVAGIVLGLAAQKTIGNFFTGLQIALTQPIRIDDAVVVEGEWGWIEEINLTYVVVKIWDQRRLILPITYFVEKPFQNWTRRTADILGSVMLWLDYSFPISVLREELDRFLQSEDLWDGRVKVVQVTETTDKAMQVRILVSAGDSPSAWDLRCNVREHMLTFIQENYPQSLPHLRAEVIQEAGS